MHYLHLQHYALRTLEGGLEVSEVGLDRVPDDVQLVIRLVARRPVALIERVRLRPRDLLRGLFAAVQHVVAQPHVAVRAHVPLELRWLAPCSCACPTGCRRSFLPKEQAALSDHGREAAGQVAQDELCTLQYT